MGGWMCKAGTAMPSYCQLASLVRCNSCLLRLASSGALHPRSCYWWASKCLPKQCQIRSCWHNLYSLHPICKAERWTPWERECTFQVIEADVYMWKDFWWIVLITTVKTYADCWCLWYMLDKNLNDGCQWWTMFDLVARIYFNNHAFNCRLS